MFIVIGISGKIGVGKSTVSQYLYRWGKGQRWRDLGDEVKEHCAERFAFPLEWAYDNEKKECIITDPELPQGSMRLRNVLQRWGTDICRAQSSFYWTREMNKWIMANRPDSLIIGDIRFMEEAQFIQCLGGWLFRIEPYPGYIPPIEAQHKSETDLDQYAGWHGRYRPEFGLDHLFEVAREIATIVP